MDVKKSRLLIAISSFALISYEGVASESGVIKTESGIELIPQLKVAYQHDDNIYSAADNEVSSSLVKVEPGLAVGLQKGLNKYGVNISFKQGLYSYDSQDNYLDGAIDFLTYLEPNSKNRFELKAAKSWLTEPRGTGLNEGNSSAIDEPVQFENKNLYSSYEYGAKSAKGRVNIRGQYNNKKYSNFREISKYRDLSNVLVGSKYIYNPRTGNEFFADLSFDDISYKHTRATESVRDSKDTRLQVGIDLAPTAITSGSFKLGYQKKDFTSNTRENFGGLSWEGQLNWQPLTYTLFSFVTSKAAVDPLTEGDFMKQTRHTLFWQHNWSDDFSSNLSINAFEENYVGVERKDKTLNYTAEASYKLQRWVTANVFLEANDKSSTNVTLEHDKLVVGVSFEFSL